MASTRRERHWEWPEMLTWPFGEERHRLLERLFGVGEDVLRLEAFDDEDGVLVIRVESPGIDPDKDVDISVADGMLTIKVERRRESRQEDKAGYRSEFRYGLLRRTVPLPARVREEDITASYRDGILEVRVPGPGQPAAENVRKIRVQRG